MVEDDAQTPLIEVVNRGAVIRKAVGGGWPRVADGSPRRVGADLVRAGSFCDAAQLLPRNPPQCHRALPSPLTRNLPESKC